MAKKKEIVKKKKVGRPTTYNFELAKKICMQLYDENLTAVLNSNEDYPARSTFFLWKRNNAELSDLYVNIAQDKGILFIEEIDQTIIDLKDKLLDASTANVIIQALKWKAAKFYPKMFGDKAEIDVTSGGEKLNQETKVTFINARKDKTDKD